MKHGPFSQVIMLREYMGIGRHTAMGHLTRLSIPLQHYYLAEGTMLHLRRLNGWPVEWASVATLRCAI
jgi:hypothetical protein